MQNNVAKINSVIKIYGGDQALGNWKYKLDTTYKLKLQYAMPTNTFKSHE